MMYKKAAIGILVLSLNACASDNYYYEHGKKVELFSMQETRADNGSDITYYKNSNGQKIGLRNEIIVKCVDGVDCINLLGSYGFKNIEKLSDQLFLIKLDKDEDVLSISQDLYKKAEIQISHPNFIRERKRR